MNAQGNIWYPSLDAALDSVFGEGTKITKRSRIYGGDINDAYGLELSNKEKVFLKTNTVANRRFFETEALGLRALRAAGRIGVPKVLGVGCDKEGGYSFLLLEYVEGAARIKDYWETFGRQLAMLHRTEPDFLYDSSWNHGRYGFMENNYIGANPQKNTPKERWIDFYRECRLLPQIEMAEEILDRTMRRKLYDLTEHLDKYLKEPESPSVLHGDLWSGNVLCGNDGRAWILDPAAYVGDFETDLAMTQLFGGFPPAFYEAYHEVNPIDKGYKDRKRLYQLYHLLNHANLFGGSYLWEVGDILDFYVS